MCSVCRVCRRSDIRLLSVCVSRVRRAWVTDNSDKRSSFTSGPIFRCPAAAGVCRWEQIIMPEPLSAPCNLARAPYKKVYSPAQNALCWQDTQTCCSSVNRYFDGVHEVAVH